MLQASELEILSPHSGIMKKKEKGKASAIEREGDIRMKAAIGTCIVWFVNETQNKVHYAMPVRTMLCAADMPHPERLLEGKNKGEEALQCAKRLKR